MWLTLPLAQKLQKLFENDLMYLPDDSDLPKYSQEEETEDADIIEKNEELEATDEDDDPPLDEEDLEENGLSVEEADQVEWEPSKSGSASSEEKDITD